MMETLGKRAVRSKFGKGAAQREIGICLTTSGSTSAISLTAHIRTPAPRVARRPKHTTRIDATEFRIQLLIIVQPSCGPCRGVFLSAQQYSLQCLILGLGIKGET